MNWRLWGSTAKKQNGQICSDDSLTIPLGSLPFAKDGVKVSCIYPSGEPVEFGVQNMELTVCFEKPVMARLFEIKRRCGES